MSIERIQNMCDTEMNNATTTEKSTQVWVEKYRPANFDDIVLDPLNRKIMENIITQNYFPNLLLYGPSWNRKNDDHYKSGK